MAQTKKFKRINVGSVVKSNDPDKPNYMKFQLKHYKTGESLVPGGVLTLKDGDTLSVESKSFQIKSAEKAAAAGKITEEVVEKIRARLENQPEFVLGEIILLTRT
jgi:hypothetical protein